MVKIIEKLEDGKVLIHVPPDNLPTSITTTETKTRLETVAVPDPKGAEPITKTVEVEYEETVEVPITKEEAHLRWADGMVERHPFCMKYEDDLPEDSPNYAWDEATGKVIAHTEENLKENEAAQAKSIRDAFEVEEETPEEAVDINGDTYEFFGGEQSAFKIDGALRLAQKLNLTEMQVTDINKVARTLSLDEADNLLIKIGIAYQQRFLAKQQSLSNLKISNLKTTHGDKIQQ